MQNDGFPKTAKGEVLGPTLFSCYVTLPVLASGFLRSGVPLGYLGPVLQGWILCLKDLLCFSEYEFKAARRPLKIQGWVQYL